MGSAELVEERVAVKTLFVVAGVIVIAVICIGVFAQERDCSDKGGVRLRTFYWTFSCYDKASLRELK